MNPGDIQKLSTKVFAAKSLIGTPTSFSVSANYISNGVAKSDSLNLGAYVIGDIKVYVNDITISYVGNTPNIVGNLLNQGSTTGLFTSIQLLHPELLKSAVQNNTYAENDHPINSAQVDAGSTPHGNSVGLPPQYIGDLTPNSPTPFSIPLTDAINPGVYPISFLLVYADDLKNTHQLVLNGTLDVQEQLPSVDVKSGFTSGEIIPLFLIGVDLCDSCDSC